MKIKTNLNKNTVTIMLDDGFKIILNHDEFKELKKLIREVDDENKQEIEEKFKTYEQIKDNSGIFTNEFMH